MDRSESPSMVALKATRGPARVFAVIDGAIGTGGGARVSYLDFTLTHGITRKTLTAAIPLLVDLGLIDVEIGPYRCNVYRGSNRWRTLSEDDVGKAMVIYEEGRQARRSASR